MRDRVIGLPTEQPAIRDKCLHPSGTFVEFPREAVETSIPARFEKIVAIHPNRPAVIASEQSISYTALNQTANNIASAIAPMLGAAEKPVALLFKTGVDVIAAILAVLKLGRIYVPLDPSFPHQRNHDVMQDAAPRLILTNEQNYGLAAQLAGNHVEICNVDRLDHVSQRRTSWPNVTADARAYILYTSGSTGKPKGVLQNHRNVLHLAMRYTNRARITPEDRVALLRSFNVHGGTYLAMAALLNGATVLPFDVRAKGLPELARWLAREEITICRMGPSLMRYLAEALQDNDRFPKLRELSFSGEALRKSDIEICRRYFPPSCVLVNSFGSTEISSCCEYIIDENSLPKEASIPCGYPASGMAISLIKDTGELAQPGEIGEIAVQSRFLALGYHGDDERTATKFLASATAPRERIYLSGDLGRFLPDGRLVHVGRVDFMVKIRGHRVELSEIEAALRSLEGIKEAVVVGDEDFRGEPRLIAYFVRRVNAGATITVIKRALRESLPDYSVPAVFVELAELPLTPNGKIDRRALPSPPRTRPSLNNPYVAPRSASEVRLAAIWSEVLGVPDIGLHDNFFDLGGHSLAAMRVASRVTSEWKCDLPVKFLFEVPTIAEMSQLIATRQSSGVKSEQQTPRLSDRGSSAQTIPQRIQHETAPLSFAQQRLWFLAQLESNSPRYNVSRALKLRGALDVEALQRSLDGIVRRHEVLRSRFYEVEGIPVQKVIESATAPIILLDLSSHESAEAESCLSGFLDEQIQRPYDLTCDTLLRTALVKLAPQDHVLLITLPHIVTDAWSMIVLCRELVTLYDAFTHDRPCALAELPIQYADYAVWQRSRLHGALLDQQLAYWREATRGISELKLPTDHQRPPSLSWHSGKHTRKYSTTLSERLDRFARAERTTFFIVLLAAFKTLLFRYTGQEDVAIGCPVANRLYAECEGLIGFFVNTLILRSDLSGDPTFRELLSRVRDMAIEAYQHQELPFDRLVQELNPGRDRSRNPLVQVSFQLRNYPMELEQLNDLIVEPLELKTGIAKFDLSWALSKDADGLSWEIEYSPDLFDGPTIERMMTHFETLLHGIVINPDQRISALPILTEGEKQQLLIDWNDTAVAYPSDKCIHELFEAQVERQANAVALVGDDRQFTYRELNRRANQLARHLRRHGVGVGSLVALCMEQSTDMIVGLLGILKAGAGYVPFDPQNPMERLSFVLEDTQAHVLLTHEKLSSELLDPVNNNEANPTIQNLKSKIQNPTLICVDRDWPEIEKESTDNLAIQTTAENLAYVIYTSGSTGTPKGVAVTHRAINRLVMNTDYIQVTPTHVMAQAANVTFDAATFEIWGALLNGAQLVIIRQDVLLSPELFSDAIERLGITTLFLTTALFNQLAQHIPGALAKLEYLLFGGEASDPERVRDLLRTSPPKHLLHVYGPTEATTFASCNLVETVALDGATVPIGKPIANTEIYILDPNLNPVPIGISGEIFIGGPGVAQGYLNNPKLTAEKFIEHSFNGEPPRRLYRTGDLARYRVEGNIELLGRLDNQVKIRGYRIEPGEVEAVLRAHPAVRECVVIAREVAVSNSDNPKPVLSIAEASKTCPEPSRRVQNPKSEKRLVAYLTTNGQPQIQELRAFAKQKLPDYMVPNAFSVLDNLPLTPNGKVDRNALPAPDYDSFRLESRYVAPRNSMEEMVAAIWSDVLGLPRIGVRDNFFDVGGHSLKATQVVSRLRTKFNANIRLHHIFECPTIAELAALIGENGSANAYQGDRLLGEIENMSEEEAHKLLAK